MTKHRDTVLQAAFEGLIEGGASETMAKKFLALLEQIYNAGYHQAIRDHVKLSEVGNVTKEQEEDIKKIKHYIDCWKDGPEHYDCALHHIFKLYDKL